jgi:Xaa-Pro aminopeptidase
VHEGPYSIGTGTSGSSQSSLEPGLVFSDEPAIYREGKYGIRTENLILVKEDEENEFGQFLKFETLTLCYIEKTLIDKSLLNPFEVKWVNQYHSKVYQRISPFLTIEEKEWLKMKTEEI